MIDLLKTAAGEGGKILLDKFNKDIAITQKLGFQNIVTEADFASQQKIQAVITKLMLAKGYRREDIGFIGEEKLQSKGKFTFIIDPLDGTNNFASGFSYFGISIAVYENEKPLVGVVYQPTTDTYYCAEKGKGAFKIKDRNITRLKIKYRKPEECLLTVYLSSIENIRNEVMKIISGSFSKIRGVRVLGAGALDICNLADNCTNITLYGKCGLWDIAAAKIILEEAGGWIGDWKGHNLQMDFSQPEKPYKILACHPKNKSYLLQLIKQTNKF